MISINASFNRFNDASDNEMIYDLETIINEILTCFNNKQYLAALMMSLTLPDTCSKLLNPHDKRKGYPRYAEWINKWCHTYYPDSLFIEDSKDSFGFILYKLRCSLLHSNDIDICKDYGAYDLDQFELYVEEDNGINTAMTYEDNKVCGDIEALKKAFPDKKIKNSKKIRINIRLIIESMVHGAIECSKSFKKEYPEIKIDLIKNIGL